MSINDFTRNTIRVIRSIPKGRVLTYGLVAQLAGDARAARQISRTLHSLSKKYNLPWHRIINSKGIISLKPMEGREHQKWLLEQEGVKVSEYGEIDLTKYLWKTHSRDYDNIEDT